MEQNTIVCVQPGNWITYHNLFFNEFPFESQQFDLHFKNSIYFENITVLLGPLTFAFLDHKCITVTQMLAFIFGQHIYLHVLYDQENMKFRACLHAWDGTDWSGLNQVCHLMQFLHYKLGMFIMYVYI